MELSVFEQGRRAAGSRPGYNTFSSIHEMINWTPEEARRCDWQMLLDLPLSNQITNTKESHPAASSQCIGCSEQAHQEPLSVLKRVITHFSSRLGVRCTHIDTAGRMFWKGCRLVIHTFRAISFAGVLNRRRLSATRRPGSRWWRRRSRCRCRRPPTSARSSRMSRRSSSPPGEPKAPAAPGMRTPSSLFFRQSCKILCFFVQVQLHL